MTARAFLRLSEGLREAFASAQDDETLRYLRVEVVDGDCLEAVGSKQKGDLETDFDVLAQASEKQASRRASKQACNARPRGGFAVLLLRMASYTVIMPRKLCWRRAFWSQKAVLFCSVLYSSFSSLLVVQQYVPVLL